MSKNFSSKQVADVMNLLGNQLRVDIIKLIFSAPRSFTDLLNHLPIESTSKLSFHLSKMDQLLTKRESDGLYELSEMGTRVYDLLIAYEADILPKNQVINEKQLDLSHEERNEALFSRNPATLFIILGTAITSGSFLVSLLISEFLYKNINSEILLYLAPVIGLVLYLYISYKLNISFEDTIFASFIFLNIYLFQRLFIGIFSGGFPLAVNLGNISLHDYSSEAVLFPIICYFGIYTVILEVALTHSQT